MKITENDLKRMTGRVKHGKHHVHLWIGIDPGRHTGVAVWSSKAQQLLCVESMKAVQAEIKVMNYWTMSLGSMSSDSPVHIHVVVEDTRDLRLPAKLQNSGRLKGVGSVHAEMRRWSEFLSHHGIIHTMAGLSPKQFREGSAEWFNKHTGWTGRSNDHGRCAAGLVHGR